MCAGGLVFASAAPATAQAQNWTGAYAGVTIGAALQMDDADESVAFDTNLDGTFADTVRSPPPAAVRTRTASTSAGGSATTGRWGAS